MFNRYVDDNSPIHHPFYMMVIDQLDECFPMAGLISGEDISEIERDLFRFLKGYGM